MHNFEKLNVYQKSLDVVDYAYGLTLKFPKEEMFALSNQLRRAVTSIVLNIAEGSGRTKKEFAHFLNMARTSAYECSAIAEIARRRNYITEKEFEYFYTELEIIIKMLNKLKLSVNC